MANVMLTAIAVLVPPGRRPLLVTAPQSANRPLSNVYQERIKWLAPSFLPISSLSLSRPQYDGHTIVMIIVALTRKESVTVQLLPSIAASPSRARLSPVTHTRDAETTHRRQCKPEPISRGTDGEMAFSYIRRRRSPGERPVGVHIAFESQLRPIFIER